MLMAKTRALNDTEKCELINALACARVNNAKKAEDFKNTDSGERFNMWAQLDEGFIELIRDGRIVIVEDGDEE